MEQSKKKHSLEKQNKSIEIVEEDQLEKTFSSYFFFKL